MKIKTLLGFNEYSLIVCNESGNLYHLSIIDQENKVHNFEGIYPTLQTAIEQGKSVIQNLEYLQQNTSY
ncbi:hypothetical protein [Pleurocapsa sp. PCC 7319]|uniref:hypothetical protein n=1 Tax=Pleurocapsa sp. PCC 7319 TaxID=118161 RepID=UPI00034C6249|nr:hypothetical protein [Pleurocapsa sp. PCC 7319]